MKNNYRDVQSENVAAVLRGPMGGLAFGDFPEGPDPEKKLRDTIIGKHVAGLLAPLYQIHHDTRTKE